MLQYHALHVDVLLFPEFMDALLQLLTDFRRIGYQYECVLRHEVMLSKRIRMHDGLGPLRLQYKTSAPFCDNMRICWLVLKSQICFRRHTQLGLALLGSRGSNGACCWDVLGSRM